MQNKKSIDWQQLVKKIKIWSQELGFQDLCITDTNVTVASQRLKEWLSKNYHADMGYLARNHRLRDNPHELVPSTARVIMVRMNYLPTNPNFNETLRDKHKGYISRYAVGRDYHKLIRRRLGKLAKRISTEVGEFTHRAFADSAPVFEKPLAEKAGIGWMGKNTLILNRHAGSFFFLGALYTNLPLPLNEAVENHCGSCTACLDICPTKAFVAPYVLDSRRCISYWTIENKGAIPEQLRPFMGNRIYGCDDCQIICPWNKFAKTTEEPGFESRHNLTNTSLIEFFSWSEQEFLQKTEGSAMRRISYEGWLRNVAVALGNAPSSVEIITALKLRENHCSTLVREHVKWALKRHTNKFEKGSQDSANTKSI